MTDSPSWKQLQFATGATRQLTAALKSGTAVSLTDECMKECNSTCFCCASIWYRTKTESGGDDGCTLMTTSLITSSEEQCELDCTSVCWNKQLTHYSELPNTFSHNTETWYSKWSKFELNKKLCYCIEQSTYVVLSWCTIWHFSGENLLMANQPLLRHGPQRLPNSVK